jgi:hypothetical protein
MTEAKKFSTTQLAKTRGIVQSQLFSDLSDKGLIKKENDKWILTEAGEKKENDKWILTEAGEQLGGVHLTGKYGQYVAWPEDVKFDQSSTIPIKSTEPEKDKLITATAIGKHFDLSSKKMNYILSELGWINRGLKGWLSK